jgi:N-acetylglucosamine malate deacetylase 1
MSTLKRILVIAPHADDEALGVGGSAAKHLELENEVYLIICGKRKNDSPEQIKNATEQYTKTYQLPYEDESYYSVFNAILDCVESIYVDVRPDVVYIPNHGDFNRDHRCVHEVCEIITRRYQQHPPEKILMYEIPSSTTQSFNNNFKCNYYEQLSQQHIIAKINTMKEYKNELREFPNPRSRDGLMTYAKFRGMECGCEFAEGFHLIYQKS